MAFIRNLMKKGVKPGPSIEECNKTITHVWGEAADADGNRVISRLHGPEAGLIWTSRAMIAGVKKVLSGNAPPGFQTPAMAYGADFVLDCEGVTREDVD
jgi:saccharopine dehydrogenase (NAD+, L-lysine-forming)